MKVWSQTYPLAEGAGLYIQQHSGPVQIAVGPGGEVKVTATCREEVDVEEYLEIRQTDKGLILEVKPRRWFGGVPQIRLDVAVPQGTPCQVESGSGPVEISATGAPVRVETGSGPVRVNGVGHTAIETGSGSVQGRNINGSATAETGSGGVEFAYVNGALSLEVGSGAISVRQINGDLRGETGSGRVQIEDVGGRVELDTGSGGVDIRRVRGASLTVHNGGGALQLKEIDVAQLDLDTSSGGADVELLQIYPGGSYSVITGSGGVAIALPAAADLRIRADASSGRINRSGLDLRVLHEAGGELEAVMGQGLAKLVVEAGSGGIRLAPGQAAPRRLSPEGERVVEAVKGDPALESSDQLRRIVQMVEDGKLTPQEAEQLLTALDEEEPA